MGNVGRLEKELDQIYLGNLKLHVLFRINMYSLYFNL